MTYKLIRSNRKSIAIEVRPEGILVRAPFQATQAQIDAFVLSRADWIRNAQAKIAAAPPPPPVESPLSMEEIRDLANKALAYIPSRVKHYAPLVGVSIGRITIRNQRSRWGSCSTKGNLNFNCLLMLTPPEVIDSVVVHELCHRKEMNHSKAFYAEVLRVFPDYWKWDKWLKENGDKLMRRMIG
jgi:predicted metal-dependent hydrolase